MCTVRRTPEFDAWLHKLKDDVAVVRITARIVRADKGISAT
jgi:putative component of toxin-antitoxin plasmid stabilization module